MEPGGESQNSSERRGARHRWLPMQTADMLPLSILALNGGDASHRGLATSTPRLVARRQPARSHTYERGRTVHLPLSAVQYSGMKDRPPFAALNSGSAGPCRPSSRVVSMNLATGCIARSSCGRHAGAAWKHQRHRIWASAHPPQLTAPLGSTGTTGQSPRRAGERPRSRAAPFRGMHLPCAVLRCVGGVYGRGNTGGGGAQPGRRGCGATAAGRFERPASGSRGGWARAAHAPPPGYLGCLCTVHTSSQSMCFSPRAHRGPIEGPRLGSHIAGSPRYGLDGAYRGPIAGGLRWGLSTEATRAKHGLELPN